jgi:hypothetical protein
MQRQRIAFDFQSTFDTILIIFSGMVHTRVIYYKIFRYVILFMKQT